MTDHTATSALYSSSPSSEHESRLAAPFLALQDLFLWEANSQYLFLTIFIALPLCYYISSSIYSATLHPLADLPGPLLSSFSRIPLYWHSLPGYEVHWINSLHRRYGPVVRYGPNDLSYADAGAWGPVAGLEGANGDTSQKRGRENARAVGHFVTQPGCYSILTTPDFEDHARVRRIFAPAFSDRALKRQEFLFRQHFDLMNSKISEVSIRGNKPVDIASMFNFTTFDIMGDLCFGQPLGLLENTSFSPWVSSIFDSIKILPFFRMINYYPILQKMYDYIEPNSIKEMKESHRRYTADRVDLRLRRQDDETEMTGISMDGIEKKPDIWSIVLGANEGKGLSLKEMHINAELFMLAGTETTATLMSGLSYYLMAESGKMDLLREEIRGAFSSPHEITMESIANLNYLNACIQEALRIYPPAPSGIPRIVCQGGRTILGRWVPPGTQVLAHHYAMYHSPANFRDPDDYVPERWLVNIDKTNDPIFWAKYSLDEYAARYANDRREALKPFSWGPKNCIGQNMAMHEIRLGMALLIWNFDLDICEESIGWRKQKVFALWEKGSLWCRVRASGK